MTAIRRFPQPWSVRANDNCFWVEDADGKRFGYTYFAERTYGIGSGYGLQLTREEAWRIARNIAKLPDLLSRAP